MTAKSVDADFVAATVEWRGASKELLVYSIPVLWYSIGRTNLVTPVIARHPTSTMHDDFFSPTDLDAGAPWVALQRVASQRAGRWPIECVNRQVKQILGAEDPQCWRH